MPTLILAHSPDPDDVFMWWPITGMIDRHDHNHIVLPPEIDTGDITFKSLPADIAVLNRRAVELGDLDITALSIFAWANVRDRYALTSFGASMGYGYGPKIVTRSGNHVASEPFSALPKEAIVAIPGVQTTAFLLLSMILGPGTFQYVQMPFDEILAAVRDGRQGATHGLLIHQSQLTFADMGLTMCVDVGAWWLEKTGLPLPLGGNAIRRDLDARYGSGVSRRVVNLMSQSIAYALKHRDRSIKYAMLFAPEIDREQAERYIDMYVSDLTVDAGEAGRGAIERLLNEAAKLGLCPSPGTIEFARPT